jgi:hypothetical protein
VSQTSRSGLECQHHEVNFDAPRKFNALRLVEDDTAALRISPGFNHTRSVQSRIPQLDKGKRTFYLRFHEPCYTSDLGYI